MAYDYWKEREEDWLKQCEDQEQDWAAELAKNYQDMLTDIDQQIALFYAKFANGSDMTMAEAKRYLDKTDMEYYSALAKKYCQLAAQDMRANNMDHAAEYFSDEANEQMARYNATMKINRLEMLKSQLLLAVEKAQSKTEGVIEKALNQRVYDEFRRQAGILGSTVLSNIGKRTEQIVHASFHGAKFSDRIWGTHQKQLQKALNRGLTQGLVLGTSVKKLSAQVKNELGVPANQASRLMRTELARVQIEAQMESFKKLGFDKFEFVANPGCCEECQKLAGKTFPIDDERPGENAPPLHPNCRCSTAPSADEESYEAWLDSGEAGEVSYEEWRCKSKIAELLVPDGDPKKVIFNPSTINTDELVFDDYHVNSERNHGVSSEQAKQYVQEAVIALNLWNGTSVKYIGPNGAAYVFPDRKVIRTSFAYTEFDESFEEALKIYEEFRNKNS